MVSRKRCLYLNSNVAIFIILTLLAVINGTIFGLDKMPLTSDAGSYNSYATNLALGNGYHLYNSGFSTYREPAYPFFVSIIYAIFGIQNLIAVKIAQMLLVAGIAFFIYLSFRYLNYKNTGLAAAGITSAMPYFGYYASTMMSEIFFAFLIVASFYLLLRLLSENVKLSLYILLGLILGVATLTKSVLLFSPLFVALIIFYFRRDLRKTLCFLVIYILCVGAWIGYVNKNTGHPSITEGRLDVHIYTRATRSTLSYKNQAYYLYSWMRRSVLGGNENDILLKYDEKPLVQEYSQRLKQGESETAIETKNIKIIIRHFDGYFLGSIVEYIKLMSIDHIFPPVPLLLTRVVRASFYLALYGFFLFGSMRFLLYNRAGPKIMFWISAFYLAYNSVMISLIDAYPRFNIPYLPFYIVMGMAGLSDIFDKKLSEKSLSNLAKRVSPNK